MISCICMCSTHSRHQHSMLKMDLLVSCGEPWPSQQLWMLWQMKSLYSVEVKRDVFQNVNMMSYTIKEVHKYGFPIRKKKEKARYACIYFTTPFIGRMDTRWVVNANIRESYKADDGVQGLFAWSTIHRN